MVPTQRFSPLFIREPAEPSHDDDTARAPRFSPLFIREPAEPTPLDNLLRIRRLHATITKFFFVIKLTCFTVSNSFLIIRSWGAESIILRFIGGGVVWEGGREAVAADQRDSVRQTADADHVH